MIITVTVQSATDEIISYDFNTETGSITPDVSQVPVSTSSHEDIDRLSWVDILAQFMIKYEKSLIKLEVKP